MPQLKRRYREERLYVEIRAYSRFIPFNNSCTICEHTLTSNDVLTPQTKETVATERLEPVPSFGAIYRLIGNGVNSPTFAPAFKKSSSSGNYDPTLGVLNLVTFLYDGHDYWYSIIQPA